MKFILFVLLFVTTFANAQPPKGMGGGPKIGIMMGVVTDSVTKKPIDYASVRLLSIVDSLTVMQIYTDEKGIFNMEQIPTGKYFVKITYFGYTNEIISDIVFTNEIPSLDLGTIKMNPEKSTTLEEVNVVAKQELLTTSLDKKVYNVGEDLSVKGGTVNDILNNVPSIEIDQDGKISLRGDGNVTILIDGRPSSISGGNGKSLLDALPAGSVERIEIVNNPSAKYDPDGTSGIINIVLKKNKLRGVNGNVTLSAGTGNTYNGTASLSLRNAKVNLYGTYAYRYYEGERNNEGYIRRTVGDSIFRLNQDRIGTDLNMTHTARIGADFYLKARNTFGFAMTGNFTERERTGNLVNQQFDQTQDLQRLWNRKSSDPSNNQSGDLNLNYKWDFKADKGNLTFDLTQSLGKDNTKGFYDEFYSINNELPDYTPSLSQQLNSKEKNNVTTFQTDYVYLMPKSMRIESGAKAIIRNSGVDTYSETRNNATNEYEQDTLANFVYEYNEQIYSTYGNFAQQIKKFKYQGGLRIEQALQAPALVSQNKSFRNEYFNIFPSAYVSYKLGKTNDITLGYSRRINRPSSENLNPFTSYADPFNLRRGNPSLKPEYINSFDLGYTQNFKKVNLTANVYYRQTTDVIQRVKEFYETGATAVTYANIDESKSLGTELVLVYKPFPWMRNVFSLNGNQIQYTDNTTGSDWNNSGFNWGVKYAGSYDFWKKTATIQVNARYNAPITTAQGIVQPRASVDLSGDKTLKGNWTVGFRLSDVFNTQEFRLEVEQPNVFQYARFKQNTRRFYINISYKFGKYDVSKKSKVQQESGGGGGDF